MPVTIVCEAGLNHGGDLNKAKRLADVAKTSGADIVKFQTYDPVQLMRLHDPDFVLLSELALPRADFIQLAKYCEGIGIEFMTTPGEVDSLKFAVEELGVKRIKLGSDDLTNARLQWAARQTGLPRIQSTGMATMEEVHDALGALGVQDLTLLHCVSCYPCRYDQVNMRAMNTMRQELEARGLGVPIGYSDHTGREWICQLAVGLGASMIEAHVMLMDGAPSVDAAVSFTPMHFATLVKGIRLVEAALGDGVKEPNEDELKLIPKVRKGPDGFRGIP